MQLVRQPWVLWLSVALHLLWGFLLVTSSTAQRSTGLGSYVEYLDGIGIERVPAGLIMIAAALATAVAVLATKYTLNKWLDRKGFWLLFPLQLILFVVAFGQLNAIINAQFLDGVTRPTSFILADQVWGLFLFCTHTGAILAFWHSRYLPKAR